MRFFTVFGLLLVASLATSSLAQTFTTACAQNRSCGSSMNTFCTFGSCFTTNECTQSQGLLLGATCTNAATNTISCDNRFGFCGSGNVCTAKVGLTTACDALGNNQEQRNAACQTGLCASNACTAVKLPGETCSSSNECRASIGVKGNMACNNGVCGPSSGGANGNPCCIGAACTTQLNCNNGLYCNSVNQNVDGTCAARLAAGATCTIRNPDPNQCVAGHICTNTTDSQSSTGSCTKFYSAAVTQDCGTISGDFICRDELACNTGGKCTSVSNTTACSNDNGCGNDGSCQCNGNQALCTVSGQNDCSNDFISYIDCLATEGCNAPVDTAYNPTFVFTAGTCANKCKVQFANYHCCRGTEWRLPSGEFTCPTPTPTPTPVQDQVDGVGLGLGVPLFFIALVVSLLILCEIPQQRSPYLWLSLCWWHMWDHEIDEFIKEHELSIAKTIKFGFSGQEEVVEEEVVVQEE